MRSHGKPGDGAGASNAASGPTGSRPRSADRSEAGRMKMLVTALRGMGFEATVECHLNGGAQIAFTTDNERADFLLRARHVGARPSPAKEFVVRLAREDVDVISGIRHAE